MSNYIEYKDRIAFHPGYYLKEIVEESGLTQEDFARRLGTTPKNLSILIRGEQSLSIDIATKLSRMLGTTIAYWLNLQQTFDEMQAEFLSEEELQREKEIFKLMDYKYFQENFYMPEFSGNIEAKIKSVREFLNVASLAVLSEKKLAVNFRSYSDELSEKNIVNANAMVQIAVNKTLTTVAPKFNKSKFVDAVDFALTQTKNHAEFYPVVKNAFLEAGVVLVALPNMKNSGINGATKKVDGKIMLMVNDRRHYADTFWFTLFHEIGHILNGDYGITLKDDKTEDEADIYARNKLIPQEAYEEFVNTTKVITEQEIRAFAKKIGRDSGIVLGRLMKDGIVPFTDIELSDKLRHKYKVRFVAES